MLKLSPDQQYAVQKVLEGYNVFLTGEAGSGKTAAIDAIREKCDRNLLVVCAPTGKAASNVRGQTIHSLFQLPVNTNQLCPLTINQANLLRAIEVIIIDEISMVRVDVLDAIDRRLKEVGNPSKAFGGKQLILVGDFFQLPPIVSTPEEITYLYARFGGTFAFYTPAWKEANFIPINLSSQHRQSNDPLFTDILNKIRVADILSPITVPDIGVTDVISALNHNVRLPLIAPCQRTSICSTNDLASEINFRRLSSLPEPNYQFTADIRGIFPESDFPTNAVLELKVGAKVILLNNLKDQFCENYTYTNGSTGHIHAIDELGNIFVWLDNGRLVSVTRHRWEAYEYQLTEDSYGNIGISSQVVGTFEQYPLRLGYAMTIHKSQGMTMERAHIVLGNSGLQAGQLYVALSRCRSLDGLTFDREIEFNDIRVDLEVYQFMTQLFT